MSFGGPYSELNKRMREFREENKQRRDKRNRYRESAGINTASSDHYSSRKRFSEQDRQAFLKELKAEKFNNKVKTTVAILLSLAIGAGVVWLVFL
jgi:hypothetical protein